MQIQQQQQWAHALPFLSPQSCISGSIFNAVSGQCRFVVLWGTGSPQGTAWPTHCVAEDLWWWGSSCSAYWRAWFTGKLGGCAAQLPAGTGCGTAWVSRCAWEGWGPWLYLLGCRLLPSSLGVPLLALEQAQQPVGALWSSPVAQSSTGEAVCSSSGGRPMNN